MKKLLLSVFVVIALLAVGACATKGAKDLKSPCACGDVRTDNG